MKSAVDASSQHKFFPAVFGAVQITPSADRIWLDDQFTLGAGAQADQLSFIRASAATQTGAARSRGALSGSVAAAHASLPASTSGAAPASVGCAAAISAACCAAALSAAFSSAASASLRCLSSTCSLADLCNDSAFSLLMPSTSMISSNSLCATSSADLNPSW